MQTASKKILRNYESAWFPLHYGSSHQLIPVSTVGSFMFCGNSIHGFPDFDAMGPLSNPQDKHFNWKHNVSLGESPFSGNYIVQLEHRVWGSISKVPRYVVSM